jgi:hypothetical protein
METKSMIPIVLCATETGRAVIFGYVKSRPRKNQSVTLHNARMIIYWSSNTGGLFGLCSNGPKEGCKITAAVEETTETVWKEWIKVSPTAAKEIADWPAFQ